MWIEFSWFRIGSSDGYCEHGDYTPVPQNGPVVFHHVYDYQLLKKGSIPCSLLVCYSFVPTSCLQARLHFCLKVWELPFLGKIPALLAFSCHFHYIFFQRNVSCIFTFPDFGALCSQALLQLEPGARNASGRTIGVVGTAAN
jgi:hypothetical protein